MEKPESVSSNQAKSDAWDAVTADYEFRACDVPQLEMLCHWYAVARECIDCTSKDGKAKVLYMVDGEPRLLPYITALQYAQAEIAALNKQLGIAPGAVAAKKDAEVTPLHAVQRGREDRKPAPKDRRRA